MEMFEGSKERFDSLMPATVPTFDDLYSRNLLDAAEEVIYFKDVESRFLRVSLGCARLHRRTQDEMIGLTDFDLFDVSHARAAFEDEQQIITTGVAVVNKKEQERWNGRPDTWVASSKFPFRDHDGTITGTFGISRDVTRRVLAEQESARLALATQATNRRLRQVEGQLRSVLDGSTDRRIDGSTDTIARYDLALRYRYINPAGERLTTLARRGDTVARLGGDEFVILCEGVSNLGHIRDIGNRFVAALAEPYREGTTVIAVSASVGTAMTDDPTSSPSDLLSRADGAMYPAKTNGRNQFHLGGGSTSAPEASPKCAGASQTAARSPSTSGVVGRPIRRESSPDVSASRPARVLPSSATTNCAVPSSRPAASSPDRRSAGVTER